eukprot:CAMPEP_0176265988 /NCGR_PEP_ID=MMETSP0121_2-20121125/42422_1 /TAXON_ID=160619 /ORGANISM="Kryptoperidinium foliaceum, Strain CCMP 1326" /LENGTH=46 /DNA_ID= /DNA_START= /DNA_END= /DNA_ORIENTATION=
MARNINAATKLSATMSCVTAGEGAPTPSHMPDTRIAAPPVLVTTAC